MNERKKESALERQRRLVATLPQTPEQVARLTPCAALGKGAKPVWCGHCRQTVMPGDACASGVKGLDPAKHTAAEIHGCEVTKWSNQQCVHGTYGCTATHGVPAAETQQEKKHG